MIIKGFAEVAAFLCATVVTLPDLLELAVEHASTAREQIGVFRREMSW